MFIFGFIVLNALPLLYLYVYGTVYKINIGYAVFFNHFNYNHRLHVQWTIFAC